MTMDIREKLVELFDEAARICNNQDCRACGYFREANCINKTIIDHLIANGVTVQEWIPVTERLPGVDKTKSGYESIGVIVMVAGYRKSAFRIYERAVCRGKTVYRWKFPWDIISDENITHWMPLPEAPKGE